MGLKKYKAKRNFRRTKEPAGAARSRAAGSNRFVVQKHQATRLHYDFRLEMEGVLKSWAVPKGFPATRGDRRLAVEVEDHPVEYGGFEGIIPPGNYGAGTVMLWDEGTYRVGGDEPPRAWREGKLHLWLKGKKLKGEWTLVRLRKREEDDKNNWLLMKTGDDVRPIGSRLEDQSVRSKRTMKQITEAADREWQSNRPQAELPRSARLPPSAAREAAASGRAPSSPSSGEPPPNRDLERLPKGRAEFRPPMKALLTETLPKGPDWIYEIKFDGVRALALKQGRTVKLVSRAENDLTAKYGMLANEIRRLPFKEAVIDGEIVALDEAGRSSFQLLQSYHTFGANKPPLVFYAFDLLHCDGRDLGGLPLCERKTWLEQVLAEHEPGAVLFSGGIQAQSDRLIQAMRARGLEGIMAKRRDSTYVPGQRTGAWLKFKWGNEQEFVIGGYTEPQGSRSHFGAVLVGYYNGDQLLFAGKVGTGFNERLLEGMWKQFQQLRRSSPPFANGPGKGADRFLSPAAMRRCTWVEPQLVCQVRFTEWTRESILRQPSFQGLREDKNPREVVLETAAHFR